jgi:transposase
MIASKALPTRSNSWHMGARVADILMTVRGIGPLIASAMVAAKVRNFAARLGLVPKQMSTGDRTILGRVSKRGNR